METPRVLSCFLFNFLPSERSAEALRDVIAAVGSRCLEQSSGSTVKGSEPDMSNQIINI